MAKSLRQSGPSLFLCLVAAVFSIVLGAIVGMVSLVTREVKVVESIPAAEDRLPGEQYFVQGQIKGGEKWRRTRDNWIRNRSLDLVLTEAELNQWATAMVKSELEALKDDAKKKKEEEELTPEQRVIRDKRDIPGQRSDPTSGILEDDKGAKQKADTSKAEQAEDSSGPLFELNSLDKLFPLLFGSPNIHLTDGRVQLGVAAGIKRLGGHASLLRFTGTIKKQDTGTWAFVPDDGQMGHAPLALRPEVLVYIWQYYHGRLTENAEYKFMQPHWARIEDIVVEPGLVRVRLSPDTEAKTPVAVPTESARTDMTQVVQCFSAYRQAVITKNGDEALKHLSFATIRKFDDLVQLARSGDKATLQRLPLVDRLTALYFRFKITPEQLRNMDGAAAISFGISNGFIGKDADPLMAIAEVEVDGDRASGELIAKGLRTGMALEFAREPDGWRLDIDKLMLFVNKALTEAMRSAAVSEEEFLRVSLKVAIGTEPPKDLWAPVP